MNGKKPFLILGRSVLILAIPFILIACASEDRSGRERTGSKEKGMLEKGEEGEELLGRIRTLEGKYDGLKEAPSHLSDSSKKHWDRSIAHADSILDTLEARLEKKGSEGPEGKMKRTIDRTLQRLAAQARSMENAKGTGNGRPSP